METRRDDQPARILVISPSESTGTIRFTFSSGANFTYSLPHLIENSEYISTSILRNQQKTILDLYELGWDELCPYLMIFLEFIGGSYEYPLTTQLGLLFLKFSEFFVLQGSMAAIDTYVLRTISLSEVHFSNKKWWTFRVLSLSVVEKVISHAIQTGAACIDVMRAYLDWMDEKSFRNAFEVQQANCFILIQRLMKIQKFYSIAFPDKKEALKTVCREYEVAYQVFDMQELIGKGWV